MTEGAKRIPLYSMILTRKELFEIVDYKTFEPFSGIIDPKIPQCQKIKELFDKRFGFSELIADKERLKQFIADKKQQIGDFVRKREITLLIVASAF